MNKVKVAVSFLLWTYTTVTVVKVFGGVGRNIVEYRKTRNLY